LWRDVLDAECLSCQIVHGKRVPLGGTILETRNFHAHQDMTVPVPGLVIVAARRHVRCLDELTDEETNELLPLVSVIRRAQRTALGIEHVYYFYNEDTPAHFHLWMVPRHDWMAQFGRSIESVRPAFLHARESFSNPEGLAEVERSVALLRTRLRH
jgi:diadenosine tetraphosphate (Ap4A) HIT family hydrolase